MQIEDSDRLRKIVVTPDDGSEATDFVVSRRARLLVEDGDRVDVGQQLTAGTPDPHDVLRVLGVRRCRSTWWTRCSRSTGPRVRRSTTSTSRSSSGRCCAGSR